MKKINIAIDGPAGAGKSTVAKLVAKELGYLYIDTGAMYRAITYKSMELGFDLKDQIALNEYLLKHPISFLNDSGQQKVFIASEDVTEKIRTPEVTNNVSLVSAHPLIRKTMVSMQRELAKNVNVVMDGRDIGTNVLPQAQLKVFLTASIEQRASRRYQELLAKGYKANLEQIKNELFLRDKKDQERAVDPLKKADDAILIDTSGLSIEEVVKRIQKYI